MSIIEVKNEYFAYLIGLGGGKKSAGFYFDIEGKYTKEEDFDGILIKSYSVSEYDSFETHVLLGEWIAEALNYKFTHNYPYNNEKLSIIKERSDYDIVKSSVIDEIKRIYRETQDYLDSLFPDDEFIYSYRVLNSRQEVQYLNHQKVTYNFISSFFSTNRINFPGRNVKLRLPVNKREILAYTNLGYRGQTLGDLEDEIIVIQYSS
ncbi:hypothetical protein [Paenibacillus polymyxa]|uniref:hypothetical protein n=1 Tax=Paenibacillus polymyxa TaxID=1406 RepID=UPI0023F9EEFB|nr:hypothetical protein [Paenibacillus polymyxa]